MHSSVAPSESCTTTWLGVQEQLHVLNVEPGGHRWRGVDWAAGSDAVVAGRAGWGADGASAPSPTGRALGCGGPPGRSATGDVVSGARHRAGRVSALAAERSGRRLVERGRLDAVIAGLLFMAGMRRSEVKRAALGPPSPTRLTATGCWSPSAEQDEPGGRSERRPVREGRRRPRDPDAQGRREPGAGGPRRAALAEDGGAAVPGGGAGLLGRGDR